MISQICNFRSINDYTQQLSETENINYLALKQQFQARFVLNDLYLFEINNGGVQIQISWVCGRVWAGKRVFHQSSVQFFYERRLRE